MYCTRFGNTIHSTKLASYGLSSSSLNIIMLLPSIDKGVGPQVLTTLVTARPLILDSFDKFNISTHMSLVVRKPAFCICENKDADQLRGNREADQRLCFRQTDSKSHLLSKSEISSLISAFVFANRIVKSLFFLNPKFQAFSHLLWLYSPVCVGPGRKPRRPVFSQRGSI